MNLFQIVSVASTSVELQWSLVHKNLTNGRILGYILGIKKG